MNTERYEWSESGRQLLKEIDKMICNIGTAKMLANHIIIENPKIFKSIDLRIFASRSLRNSYCNRKNPDKRHTTRWSIEEDELIIATLNQWPKDAAKLFPKRSIQAVRNRRVDLRKNLVIIPDAPKYFV